MDLQGVAVEARSAQELGEDVNNLLKQAEASMTSASAALRGRFSIPGFLIKSLPRLKGIVLDPGMRSEPEAGVVKQSGLLVRGDV